jgi:sporulation protein YlmC with PRC-barrel domain
MSGPFRNAKSVIGYSLHATDGDIGTVDDLYFDDERWTVRYLVVDTGSWLTGRKVLISPRAIGEVDWDAKALPVQLTKSQVEKSPDVDTRKPVSRQHEAEHLGYYEYPFYWGGSGLWGMGEYPGDLSSQTAIESQLRANESKLAPAGSADSHLQSANAVIGYHISATDGEIGHVDDMLIDERTWAIRELIVDTSNWWGGHKVLIAPSAISSVSWSDAKVIVDLTRADIQKARTFQPAAL